jgi:hypothetical protein
MKRASLIASALLLLVLGGLRVADANKTHEAQLTGQAEVGGGDPDGSGRALVNYSPSSNRICFTLDVSGIDTPTAANIYRGAAGTDGSIVVSLAPLTGNSSIGCVENVDPELLKDIAKNPGNYYVNVLNSQYPNGAIRGQLGR